LLSSTLAVQARRAQRLLRWYARLIPIARARAWFWAGHALQLVGALRRATHAWQRSLHAAQRFRLPYDEGLAHYALGRAMSQDTAGRQTHLTQACTIFQRLGAVGELQQTQEVLAERRESLSQL
jgi:hypothetical protein